MVKDQPLRFVRGHQHRAPGSASTPGRPKTPEHRAKISASHVGITHTSKAKAKIGAAKRGKSLSVEHRGAIRRSARRGETNPSWKGDEANYSTLHRWLAENHPKTGVCEHCGKETTTQYAFTKHGQPYTRERDDYLELCAACHTSYDREHFGRVPFRHRHSHA